MNDRDTTVASLQDAVLALCRRKEWGDAGVQNPQRVAMAMTVEMAELLEHFQWLDEAGVRRLQSGGDEPRVRAIAEEFADVWMYGLQLAYALGIDVTSEILRKIAIVDTRPNSRAELQKAGITDAR